ncbi:hypothetical protein GTA08_BOTSDO06092 [Botryosphaeria dothidea]|uniref:F-box domain-containing protein n=1 Tax=Botryosphaeria dothidea TaxID=55169 RepID=A0A8H4IVM0_9PEZI|nr:hypothetical protein GTA08_BOTSDO06092 [Botryosphaeria dothidea]
MGNASETVFNTTELLELILSFANLGDLLSAQRTCQRWKAVIDGSIKLQRCLYILPDRRGADCYGLNPLLVQRFRFSRDARGYLSVDTNTEWQERVLSCPSASWRRMLVSQPPEPFALVGPPWRCRRPRCAFGDEVSCGEAWEVTAEPAPGRTKRRYFRNRSRHNRPWV